MPAVHRPLAAALWMTGSIAAFSAMAVAGREVAGQHDTFEIMFWRSVVGLVIVLAVAGMAGRLGEVRRDRLGQHFIRNLFHFTGQNLWFWALTMIPLAQVFALEFTSPVWVILLSPFFLGERITRTKALAAALGFAGILIVARPDFAALDPGVLAAAASAVCFAATIILTKALTRGECIVSILFWLTGMQLCFGLIAAGIDGQVAWPTAATLPWLALIGFCGVTAHLCLTTALSLASASIVVPIDFARLPVIAAIGMWLYGEPLDALVFLGGGVILLANIINIRAANRAAAQQP
ncbi:DMT family transporter [Fertoebacter nigrum]|uniref:DMT family transporter n=1 Tax=Fertoeibacter niger TaxID=2656921 RepID=A0A8X8GYW2_9RHOB|nr:DMT family transporter [Fertoeibacter niger]NUB43004.1 DMT family transporter [Fertoeibacter niger]